MATGKRAFQRKTAVDTLAAILNEEPEPIGVLNPQVPAPLRWIVERCLAKEARQRYSATDDLARDLAGARDHVSEASLSGAVVPGTGARRRFALPAPAAVIAAVALIAAGAFGGIRYAARHVDSELPYFRRLTFGRGNLLNARFTPEGRTVVYAAAWDGKPSELFAVRTDSVESRPIGLSSADVMSVSSKGELAVLIRKTSLFDPSGTGMLARVPIAGGTPRELLEDVVRADWAPNGEDLAVLRALPNGKTQLQYPIANVLAESNDFGGAMRVSPNGDLVACIEGDTLTTYDRKGKRRVVLKGWNLSELAWSPRGDEVGCTGGRTERDYAIRAVSLSGRDRVVIPAPLGFGLHDVAPDGRILIENGAGRGWLACQPRGETRERELGRPPFPVPTHISQDGKLVLYTQGREGIYLQKTDGTPAVRLGDGSALALSADARWVLSLREGPSRELLMIPTGAGTSRKIPVEGVQPEWAWFLKNDMEILVRSIDKAGNAHLVVVGLDGGKSRTIPADEYTARTMALSPGSDRFVYATKAGQLRIASLSGGQATPVPGAPLGLDDQVAEWSADGRFLYVWRGGEIPVRVDRLELATGRRESWKSVAPPDSTGVSWVSNLVIAPDGQSYAYYYQRVLADDLYVVEGAK